MDDKNIEATIQQLEEQLLQPDVRRSAQLLDDLLADDFIEHGSSGRAYDKGQILESLTNENPVPRTLTNFKTTTLAPGVILATYHSTYWEPGAAPAHSRRCSIWKLVNGRWQMIFHQGTPTGESL
ncbi:MAG: DUF4440 domain-containing protein [Ardenticatenaceae bacterium]|nr:DUF4440 domain-containing protein [Ardenticatenaceae bacterium]MCB9445991.1 DUF4440 domain-containing protein [Ardenticatenaceae bacterium]